MSESPLSPPVVRTRGHERKVGVEIELAGLEVHEVAKCVANTFGGTVERVHDYEFNVNTEEGPFRVELDSRGMKNIAADSETRGEPLMGEPLMRGIVEEFVPSEIVTPPLPFARLRDLDSLVADLRSRGGQGSSDRLVYSFGVHFNPEAPGLGAESIRRHLQSFVMLSPYLRKRGATDLTRRVLPHITPHPVEYAERILTPAYAPKMAALIDDYLEFSPTRNRDLDMLPLFAHLDEPRVRAAVGAEEKVNPRPTYHYRLPNSEVGDPGWSILDEWRGWLVVERLAFDEAKLDELMTAWIARQGAWVDELVFPWAQDVEARLGDEA